MPDGGSTDRWAGLCVMGWLQVHSASLGSFLSAPTHSALILKVSTDLLFLSPKSVYFSLGEAFALSSSLRYNSSAPPS